MRTFDEARALQLLRIGTGRSGAEFREGQDDAIRHVVEGRGRLLVVQKTGWGKSFVYFIAIKLLREAGDGPALLVSPLLSLMRNQLLAAERMGVRARTINSGNEEEWSKIKIEVGRDEVDILLISPERLANTDFVTGILGPLAQKMSLLVVDEAHCISDWGHDFRPHYRRLERIVRGLPKNLRVLATTATANDRVMEDLKQVLGPKLEISRGDLNRASLTLQTIKLPDAAERLAWLAENLPALKGSGIIYALTKRDASTVAAWLQSRAVEVRAYTSDSEERELLEDALLKNEVKALIATTSLGMGYDKPDLGFVIHYQSPGSVVAYYQQVGRAGRALKNARGVLLSGEEEGEINDYFIESAFPTPQEVEQVLEALRTAPTGLSVPQLLERVNVSKQRIDKTLDLLALESPAPIAKVGTKWQLAPSPLSAKFWLRAKRLTELRQLEQQQMEEYVGLVDGHMEFLVKALDGNSSSVQPPTLPPLPTKASRALVREAIAFLRRVSLPIDPRKQWPGELPIYDVRGKIPPELQAECGRALCVWRDAGWGELVRRGKYSDGRFADDLVTACVALIAEWEPTPRPLWVTCVPSLRHPTLVPDFARRLAEALDLPFKLVLAKTADRPEQKAMANSAQQAKNVDGSLEVIAPLLKGPVLLVDDMVDSKWTFTVAAWLLRTKGCKAVWPLALARTGQGS